MPAKSITHFHTKILFIRTVDLLYFALISHSNKFKLTLNEGMNLLTSCCQLCNVEAGAIIKNGPHVLCVYKIVLCYLKRCVAFESYYIYFALYFGIVTKIRFIL